MGGRAGDHSVADRDPSPAGIPQGGPPGGGAGDLLRSVAPTETPQQVPFLARLPARALPEELTGSRYLVLDGLQDPGNLGTLWRTADAFGADGLLLLPGCADPWSPKTLRGLHGGLLPAPRMGGEAGGPAAPAGPGGLPLYATALGEDTQDIRTLPLGRAAVVIGSEGRGCRRRCWRPVKKTLQIPMTERCESLNAAAAGTVVLWQMGFGPVG